MNKHIQEAFLLWPVWITMSMTSQTWTCQTNLLKNSREMGSKPASWIDVKPLAMAFSTVMVKRL